MAQVPTIKIYRKADGKGIIINEADFDSAKHSKSKPAEQSSSGHIIKTSRKRSRSK